MTGFMILVGFHGFVGTGAANELVRPFGFVGTLRDTVVALGLDAIL